MGVDEKSMRQKHGYTAKALLAAVCTDCRIQLDTCDAGSAKR